MTEPADVVQQQVKAYNQHDASAFAALYSSDAELAGPDGAVLMTGRKEIEAGYATFFEQHPDLKAEITSRLAVDDTVVDEEHVTGLAGEPSEPRALILYRVENGLITRSQRLA